MNNTRRALSALSLAAVALLSGCGAGATGPTTVAVPAASTPAPTAQPVAAAPSAAAATVAAADATPDPAALNQQISDIDNQLKVIGGESSAAASGLNSSEGDPTS